MKEMLIVLGLALVCAGIMLSVFVEPASPTFVTKEIPYFQLGHYVVQPYEPPSEKLFLVEVDV